MVSGMPRKNHRDKQPRHVKHQVAAPVLSPAAIRGRMAGSITRRYALLDRRGEPTHCHPSAEEKRSEVLRKEARGSDGKEIFETEAIAQACCQALAVIGVRMRAYACARSTTGHYHLTLRV